MRLSISEMAKLCGASVRTLHYYDQIGLLCPETAADSGYRWYREADVERMQQILFFRELDFSLKDILAILSDPHYDRQEALRRQRVLLRMKRDRLDRLLDLLEPVKGDPRYRSYFWKVQAKHVDFVLCDRKLVARLVVAVDDASHDQEDRRERDRFVDAVLESVGYSVLHLRSLEMQPLEERIRAVFRLEETERNA